MLGSRVVLVVGAQDLDACGEFIVVTSELAHPCGQPCDRTVSVRLEIRHDGVPVVVVHVATEVEPGDFTIRLRHDGIPQGQPWRRPHRSR